MRTIFDPLILNWIFVTFSSSVTNWDFVQSNEISSFTSNRINMIQFQSHSHKNWRNSSNWITWLFALWCFILKYFLMFSSSNLLFVHSQNFKNHEISEIYLSLKCFLSSRSTTSLNKKENVNLMNQDSHLLRKVILNKNESRWKLFVILSF